MAQANFLLQENPQLTRALQNAQSPQEANRLMADAWKFAGYNRPGGENAPRLATTQAYANSFGDGGGEPSRRWRPLVEARWGRPRSAAASD
ncbi:hypothetical protein ACU4GR_09105 (plasmid) [Methylobacterium oryzae CBMB20]